jgi:hypothetical protein
VHLLGEVLSQGHRRDRDLLDVGECQEVRRRDRVRGPRHGVGQPDVDDELLEGAAGELRSDMEPDSCELIRLLESVSARGREGEEIVEVELLGGGDVLDGVVDGVLSPEIDVLRGPGGDIEPEVEGEGTL